MPSARFSTDRLLLANASSLFLPGSNLTNLIVLGHHPLSGGGFLALMWPAAVAASVVTACCVGVWARNELVAPTVRVTGADRPVLGIGLGAIVVVVVLVLALPSPALPVLSVGLVATLLRVAQRRLTVRGAVDTLGLPVLVGLFGITVGLGTLGQRVERAGHHVVAPRRCGDGRRVRRLLGAVQQPSGGVAVGRPPNRRMRPSC